MINFITIYSGTKMFRYLLLSFITTDLYINTCVDYDYINECKYKFIIFLTIVLISMQ